MKTLPLLLLGALVCLAGCRSVGILDAENLRRPAFDFKASGARAAEGRLVGQIETGRGDGAGLAAGGCSACN